MFGIVSRACRRIVKSNFHLSLVAAIVFAAAAPINAMAQSGFDVTTVPRADGAEISLKNSDSTSIEYEYPGSVADATRNTEKALSAGGWVQYRVPDSNSHSTLRFKRDRLGIYVELYAVSRQTRPVADFV